MIIAADSASRITTTDPKTREKAIETYLIEACHARGAATYKFISALAGVPDRIVVAKGGTVFVELKRVTGNRLSKRQEHVIKEIEAAGGKVYVIRTKTQIDTLLDELTR